MLSHLQHLLLLSFRICIATLTDLSPNLSLLSLTKGTEIGLYYVEHEKYKSISMIIIWLFQFNGHFRDIKI